MSCLDLACFLYVNTDTYPDEMYLGKRRIALRIAEAIGGKFERFSSASSEYVDLDVLKNDFYDPGLCTNAGDCMCFPFIVEIEAQDGVDFSQFLRAVVDIILIFEREGGRVVAACDFEDDVNSMVARELGKERSE